MKESNLTRREMQFLISFFFIMLGVSLVTSIFKINILTLNAWVEGHAPLIILIAIPLGLYFTLDKERIGKE